MRQVRTSDSFVNDNAKTEFRDDLVRHFVVTPEYFELVNPRNHIVLGSRGSGKTALLRMLAHDHMSRLKEPEVEAVVGSRRLLGVYVPMHALFVAGLKSQKTQDDDPLRAFRWRLNVAACDALLDTLESYLNRFESDLGKRAWTERNLVQGLQDAWGLPSPLDTGLGGLRRELRHLERQKHLQYTSWETRGEAPGREGVLGLAFEADAFSATIWGMQIAEDVLELPRDARWMMCLDEAEFLGEPHQRLLNTLLRTHAGNLVFKISTTPYGHRTLATMVEANLNVGDDFHYLYVDRDPVSWPEFDAFAASFYERRIQDASNASTMPSTLDGLLGESELFTRRRETWGPDSEQMEQLREFGTPETFARAQRLSETPQAFRDQISRKIHGPLMLYAAAKKRKGGKQIIPLYSGVETVLRCTDANPRRMIQVLHLMEQEWNRRGEVGGPLDARRQSRVLKQYADLLVERSRSVIGYGYELAELIQGIGRSMSDEFLSHALSTDQVTAFTVDATCADRTREVVVAGVETGVFYPASIQKSPEFVSQQGSFRLAYALAPKYTLLPRSGKAKSLGTLLERPSRGGNADSTNEQLTL